MQRYDGRHGPWFCSPRANWDGEFPIVLGCFWRCTDYYCSIKGWFPPCAHHLKLTQTGTGWRRGVRRRAGGGRGGWGARGAGGAGGGRGAGWAGWGWGWRWGLGRPSMGSSIQYWWLICNTWGYIGEREREEKKRYIMCTLKKWERERDVFIYIIHIYIIIYYTYVGLSGNGDYPKEKSTRKLIFAAITWNFRPVWIVLEALNVKIQW